MGATFGRMEHALACVSARVVSCLCAVLMAWAFICVSSPSAFAQTQTSAASISGTVTDNTGAVVPEVKVTLSNPDTAFVRTFTSDSAGLYSFTLVPPGTYTLTAEKQGFNTYVQKGIVLEVGQAATQDLTLQVGAVTQEINVTASAPIVDKADVNISSTVTEQATVELPLNQRNIFGLADIDSSVNNSAQMQALNPANTVQTADQDISFFNFGGGRFGTTAYLLDGTWDGAGDWDGIIFVPSVDATQEFKIDTMTFSAQYGWSMGNVLNAVTKGGTNRVHGDLFEFARNSDLDANFYWNNANGVPRPQFHRHQFGGTIGGPVYIPKYFEHTDKIFWFFDMEALRQSSPESLTSTVPTSAFESGDFTTLLGPQAGTDALGRPYYQGEIYNPFTSRQLTNGAVDPTTGLKANCPGGTATCFIRDPFSTMNVIPTSMLNSVSKNLFQYFPAPNCGSCGYLSNFSTAGGAPVRSTEYTTRADFNINDATRAFFRWSHKLQEKTEEAEFYGNDVGGTGSIAPDNREDFVMGFTRTLSPTFLASVNAGYGRWIEGRITQGQGFLPSTLGLPTSINFANSFPYIAIDQYNTTVTGNALGSGSLNSTPREAKSLAIDLTKVHGAHTINFGFMGILSVQNELNDSDASFSFPRGFTQGPDPTNPNITTGWGFASFFLGTAGNNGGAVGYNANDALLKKLFGWYIQDQWRVNRKLTLNLGLRYDFQTAPTERFDRLSHFDPNAPNPLSAAVGFNVPGELVYTGDGNYRGVYKPQLNNFAPRVSLTYAIDSKTVARAGFGLFYTPAIENASYEGLNLYGYAQSTPFVGTVDGITPYNLVSNPFPNGILQPTGRAAGGFTEVGQSIAAVLPTRPTPYMVEWTLGVEHQLTANDMISATYLGNHGVKLTFDDPNINLDELPPADLAMGDNLLTQVTNPYYPYIKSSGCGLNNPTVQQGQLLRPYPEYCYVGNVQDPDAMSWYNALSLNYRHRWSQGMQLLVSYTWAKYLDTNAGNEGWAGEGTGFAEDYYNLSNEKAYDGDDIPQSLVVSYIYQLPFGHGRHFATNLHGPADAVLGGWQVSGITTLKDGIPIGFSAPGYNYAEGQRPNVTCNPSLSNPTLTEWFNTSCLVKPPVYTFGDAARYLNVRAPGLQNWDIAMEKWATLSHSHENWKLEFRAEMFNAFNHENFFRPDSGVGDPLFGQINSSVNGGGLPARDIQFAIKIFF